MAAARNRKRKRRRRGRFSGLYKLLSVVLILIALTVGSMIFFRVEEVEVTGNERYTAQQVLEASGIQKGDSLFALNRSRVVLRIQQALPYVDAVSIRPSLPQSVVISVSESGAVASIESEGTWWLMSCRCKVLAPANGGPEGAVVSGITPLRPVAGSALRVGEGEETKLESLKQLFSALRDEELLDKVSAVDLSYDSRISFTYDERYTVKMPMTADFPKKMRALSQVVASERIGERGTIDFTIEEAPHFIPGG